MRRLTPFLVAVLIASTAPAGPAGAASGASAPAVVAGERGITFTRWDSGRQWRTGERTGVRVRQGALVLDDGATRTRRYRGTTYAVGTWRSGWTTPAHPFSELVGSWSASTPRNSWVEVKVRVASATTTGRWQVLGRWASGDQHVLRTSVAGRPDALGSVDVDTWRAASGAGGSSYRLKVRLMRRAGASSRPPSVAYVGAVVSQAADGAGPVSAPGPARGVVLDVPAYSQMTHRGELPEYGGGGEAWCSPTSTAMVLGYYGRLPTSLAWVGGHADPWVAEVARRAYDHRYEGTGNWSFNTAYAASRGLDAFVTRLRSLSEAEVLVAAGIPVVVSVSFGPGGLTGAPISATAGHLLVIVGFTASGDVVVNDPAADSNAGVRRTYDRAQLEAAWQGGSDGTAYVVHDQAHPLPPSSGTW